jgi:hypothetical protein
MAMAALPEAGDANGIGRPENGKFAADIRHPQPIIRSPVSLELLLTAYR